MCKIAVGNFLLRSAKEGPVPRPLLCLWMAVLSLFSYIVFSLCTILSLNFSLLQGQQLYWIKAHLKDLILLTCWLCKDI